MIYKNLLIIGMNNSQRHQHIYNRLNCFYNNNNIPNIIFHGSSGSGKKTIVYNFLNKIYENDKQKLKKNTMIVNCSHGKGIKFIREELKFFAKTNLHYNENIKFKSIILLNADSLTNDAQSALRRCIEQFSGNTRFFIIIENKYKLLNPILSRFCEIYVAENIENNKVINLHKVYNTELSIISQEEKKKEWFSNNMDVKLDYKYFLNKCNEIYENGYSTLDLITYIENSDDFDPEYKASIVLCFHKVKHKFKFEKLLLFYMFDYIYLRKDKSIHSL